MTKPETNTISRKPQVLMRIPSNYLGKEAMEIVKKWPHGGFSIETQVGDGIRNHNSTVPMVFIPLTQDEVNEIISEYGKIA